MLWQDLDGRYGQRSIDARNYSSRAPLFSSTLLLLFIDFSSCGSCDSCLGSSNIMQVGIQVHMGVSYYFTAHRLSFLIMPSGRSKFRLPQALYLLSRYGALMLQMWVDGVIWNCPRTDIFAVFTIHLFIYIWSMALFQPANAEFGSHFSERAVYRWAFAWTWYYSCDVSRF